MPQTDANLFNTLMVREFSRVFLKYLGDNVLLIDMPRLVDELFVKAGVSPVNTPEQMAVSFPYNKFLDGEWSRILQETKQEIEAKRLQQTNPLAIDMHMDEATEQEARAIAATVMEAQRKIESNGMRSSMINVVPIPAPVLEDLLRRANAFELYGSEDDENSDGASPISESAMHESDFLAMDAITSQDQWRSFVDGIRAKYNGFPSDWFERVILSGKLTLLASGWNKKN